MLRARSWALTVCFGYLTVSVMHETASNRAWTAIHILVRTPDGEVDVPIVELDWYVANSVSEIPPDSDTFALCVSGDFLHLEKLTCKSLR